MMVKRKANLDDGCNPELVAGAVFDGELEIPVILSIGTHHWLFR